jgi:uncharacterized protein (TIGR02466 family)
MKDAKKGSRGGATAGPGTAAPAVAAATPSDRVSAASDHDRGSSYPAGATLRPHTFVCVLVLLGVSLVANVILLTTYGSSKLWKLPAVAPNIVTTEPINMTAAVDNRHELFVVDKCSTEGYTELDNRMRSEKALAAAATFPASEGLGNEGWLWLLESLDLDRRNMDALYNLVSNYEELYEGFSSLAYSELMSSKDLVPTSELFSIMPASKIAAHRTEFAAAADRISSVDGAHFPKPCTTHAFTTMFTTYDFSSIVEENMNDELYAVSVAAYKELKASRPSLASTALNHEFFRFQMRNLDAETRSYWSSFEQVTGFKRLVRSMRFAAYKFLIHHGIDAEAALRKASHPVVIWVSVHDTESVHQPHVTNDALVGGVYYVRVPNFSGRLQLYDPRGKGPIGDGLKIPTSAPRPPFHREVSVQPKESKLVLFPGWLVHSVRGSSNSTRIQSDAATITFSGSAESSSRVPEYRVSLSLNLKGEWQDTSALHVQQTACTS